MDFQRLFLIIFLLGFISINFILPKFNKRIDEVDTIATNIQYTSMLFALILNQPKIFYSVLLIGFLIDLYRNKTKKIKTIFLELIIFIGLPLLTFFDIGILNPIPGLYFTRNSDIYLGLLITGLIFFLNLYRFSKLKSINKKYFISFLLLNLILYAENYFLIFKSIK